VVKDDEAEEEESEEATKYLECEVKLARGVKVRVGFQLLQYIITNTA